MKLGPFVTSRAPIGAQSRAAEAEVSNALSAGYTTARNMQQLSSLGQEAMRIGMQANLNRARATVAKEASDVKALIEQNPDYIAVEELTSRGVDVPENMVEDGKVRTYSIATQLFDTALGNATEKARGQTLMPATSNRLNADIDQRYNTEMRNDLQTWAVKKQREVATSEYVDQMDMYRSGGDYQSAELATEEARTSGLISDAQASRQRDITSVSKEMRATNNTILDAYKTPQGLNALEQRIADYDEKIAGDQDIVRGMTPDEAFAERQRMAAAYSQIQSANQVKISISVSNDIDELNAAAKGIPAGITSMPSEELNRHKGRLAAMERDGIGSESQRINYRNAIERVQVTTQYAPQFSAITSGTHEEAVAAYNDLVRISRSAGQQGGAFGIERGRSTAIALYEAAQTQMRERETALRSNPARYAMEHNAAVREAYRPVPTDAPIEEKVGAIRQEIKAQTSAQTDLGVAPSQQRLDENSPFVVNLTETLKNGQWSAIAPQLDVLAMGTTEDEYRMVVNSVTKDGDGAAVVQAALRTYPQDKELSRQMLLGSRMDEVSLTKFSETVREQAGVSINPQVLNGMIPALEAAYKYEVGQGTALANTQDDPKAVRALIERAVGPEVDISHRFFRSSAFGDTPPIRSYQKNGKWVDPEVVKKKLDAAVTDPKEVAKWGDIKIGDRRYSISEVAKVARVQTVGNGKYTMAIEHPDGGFINVYNDNGPIVLTPDEVDENWQNRKPEPSGMSEGS